ncbi:50S ribosomal protein L4 [Buchnera aphidicola]|uniref:Large ribosomal subunit protein uL4 n=1 Tax=Buchnera aphidicola (Stegophylla sp.) TaxID=2315800 RepID=A0A4D6YN71_9GAMM|nr:50S ribosomal protein L4 [Buchnera aphidicola (Stegophylla sp.)]QCI26485.1 50S ribosomal protein L4 [Buchnera aphidicola (Stegophylla sp.)]
MELILQDSGDSLIVSDDVFNHSFNESLVHQIITLYLSGSRQWSRAQKSKSEVSGSGKKPWRQKGTGRARVGSIRSPLWRSGGVTFAAKPKVYNKKVNRRMYRGALSSIFSQLIRQNRLLVFEDFSILYPKTKLLLKKLKILNLQETLIIKNYLDNNLFLASRNLYKVCTQDVKYINPVYLVSFKNIIITRLAIIKIEDLLLT